MSDTDPIELFRQAAARASSLGIDTAPIALGTVNASGQPAVRIVLLRHVDERGFVFHTNYESRKARDLAANPRAALCCHWPTIETQIRVEGSVEPIAADESDAYFAGRPRGSQIGAWASRQSDDLPSRETLEARVVEVEARFEGVPVPRPPFWGGFRVKPTRIEFWQGQPSRLHDRRVYVREPEGWRLTRLYP